jgi:hypothetical protein
MQSITLMRQDCHHRGRGKFSVEYEGMRNLGKWRSEMSP